MAGRKLTKATFHTIERAGGEDRVFGALAAGQTMTAIAAELKVSRPLLSRWCNDARRKDAYAHARTQGAAALAEEVVSISDNATPESVQVAKLRADARKWLSSRLDPESWGERAGATVNVNVGGLHLDALRQAGRMIDADDA